MQSAAAFLRVRSYTKIERRSRIQLEDKMLGVMLRTALACLGSVILSAGFLAVAASAKEQPGPNVFFGFENVLTPIAIKWACGGETGEDLAALEALMIAFPDDAETSKVREIIYETVEGSQRDTALTEIFGGTPTVEQTKLICAAALPLSIAWMKPEHMGSGGSDVVPPEQTEAFKYFFQTLETLE
ncbi:hypothetical protein [Paracoccus sp. IB05]|uniref:hypothetical protein n=1 Tax=Paracoccus sp. IB05 TaxID=2779367 RepID=UPI0018E75343|nr:hypothetical protein [Paracoccus sp. IB05]MBJ2154071.1 hypothetical protein [Paracoccus sp. IB05]